MRLTAAALLVIAALLAHMQHGECVNEFVVRVIVKAVRENVAGLPVARNQQNWHFNPDEGLVRRQQFESLHGRHGQYLIQSLGEGDGGVAKYAIQEGEN